MEGRSAFCAFVSLAIGAWLVDRTTRPRRPSRAANVRRRHAPHQSTEGRVVRAKDRWRSVIAWVARPIRRSPFRCRLTPLVRHRRSRPSTRRKHYRRVSYRRRPRSQWRWSPPAPVVAPRVRPPVRDLSRPAKSVAERVRAKAPVVTPRPPARNVVVAPAPSPARVVAKAPARVASSSKAMGRTKAGGRWVTSVARNWAVVRSDPSRQSRIIAAIGPNTRVQLGETRGDWRRIKAKGLAGWVEHRTLVARASAPKRTGRLAAR